jgi:hypothetical protein
MPKVTVYVRVPTTDSLKTHTYNHSFVQLGESSSEVYGFEPAGRPAATQPGRVANDSWRLKTVDYQAKMTFEVTDEQYNRIVGDINEAIKNPPNYHVLAATSPDSTDRQCSMFVDDLLKSAGLETDLVNYETPYTQFGYIKMKEVSESMKGFMPDLNGKIDIDKFITNFRGVPFSSVEDVPKSYAETGRVDGNFPRGSVADNDEAGQDGTGPVEIAALENDPEDEEDMYAYSSFYPGC